MAVFLGFLLLQLDHSDLVYLMVRTQRTRPSQCISLYITSCSNIHLSFVLSSSLYAHPSTSVRLHPWSRALCCHHHHLCLFQRDTCCRMLPLCRNAEFLCLSNFLTMLNYFIPAPFCHIFTQPTLGLPPTPIVHVRPFTPDLSFSPRGTRVRVHLARQNDKSHLPFNLFHHIHAPSQFPPIDNFIPFPSPRFLSLFRVASTYRRGPRVTLWTNLPCQLPSPFHI